MEINHPPPDLLSQSHETWELLPAPGLASMEDLLAELERL